MLWLNKTKLKRKFTVVLCSVEEKNKTKQKTMIKTWFLKRRLFGGQETLLDIIQFLKSKTFRNIFWLFG